MENRNIARKHTFNIFLSNKNAGPYIILMEILYNASMQQEGRIND